MRCNLWRRSSISREPCKALLLACPWTFDHLPGANGPSSPAAPSVTSSSVAARSWAGSTGMARGYAREPATTCLPSGSAPPGVMDSGLPAPILLKGVDLYVYTIQIDRDSGDQAVDASGPFFSDAYSIGSRPDG